ncbi:MAG: hypothetical protein JW844_00350 [Candidatus Omnitrophica bacterium]|nr:hypothetical protein [Candidatus Omnitrophota bacterium]
MTLIEKCKIVPRIWKGGLELISRYPRALFPFIFVGIADAVILTVIYLIPREPFSKLLAPVVRAFWGEQFLHYPMNLTLIPKLFQYSHIVMIGFVGVIMTGIAVGMIDQAVKGLNPGIFSALTYALRRFTPLLIVWFTMFGIVSGSFRLTQLVLGRLYAAGYLEALPLSREAVGEFFFWANILFSIVVEVAFLYVIPAIIIERRGLLSAFRRGLALSRKYFLATFLLIFVPSILYMAVIFLKMNITLLSNTFFPEAILWVLGLGIAISVVIDFAVTTAGTLLFLLDKQGSWVLEGGKPARSRVLESEPQPALNAA